jgi:hypothetical protein
MSNSRTTRSFASHLVAVLGATTAVFAGACSSTSSDGSGAPPKEGVVPNDGVIAAPPPPPPTDAGTDASDAGCPGGQVACWCQSGPPNNACQSMSFAQSNGTTCASYWTQGPAAPTRGGPTYPPCRGQQVPAACCNNLSAD